MARNRSLSVKTQPIGSISIDGIDELRESLKGLRDRDAQAILRSTIRGVAGKIRESARSRVPTDTGNLKKSIRVSEKRAKDKNKPVFTVNSGDSKSKNDGWYWRFVEFGTAASNKGASLKQEQPFIRPAVEEIRAMMPMILKQQFLDKVRASLKKKQKKLAKLEGGE